MSKSPIEIAIGQMNTMIEDEIVKACANVGVNVNKEELLNALKSLNFVRELVEYIFTYPDDDYMTMECLCRKLVKHGLIDKEDGYYLVAKGIKVAEQTEPTFKVDGIGDDDPTIHAIAHLQKVGWLQEHDRALTEPSEDVGAVWCDNCTMEELIEPSTDCPWK